MNKFFRVLGLGLMIATFAFVGFAQDPQAEKTKLYDTYMKYYQSDKAEELQMALDAAKQYNAKFNTEIDKPQNDYFNEAIPTLEKTIADLKTSDVASKEKAAWYDQLKKVVDAANAKNWAETFAQGKTAIDKQFQYLDKTGGLTADTVKGHKLDIAIALGAIGFDRAAEKNDTFNNEAITNLKSAIQQLESSAPSTTTFGKAVGYDLKNKDNSLGLLNYYIGYIMYYRQKKETEAIPYLYKSTQYGSVSKDFSDIYRIIGKSYFDKIAALDKERLDKITANNNEDNEETIALLAKEKGYADRALDAYARALKLADKATPEYKKALRESLEETYKFRFDKTDGVDTYIATVTSKPFPDPASPVQPVTDEKKTETTTPTGTSTGKTSTSSTTITTTPGAKQTVTTNGKTMTTTEVKKTNGKTTTTETKTTTTAKKPRRK